MQNNDLYFYRVIEFGYIIIFWIPEVEMREEVHHCKESLYLDPVNLAGHSRSVIGYGRRVHQMACNLVDTNHDPVYRNGVMIYVQQLNKGMINMIYVLNTKYGHYP